MAANDDFARIALLLVGVVVLAPLVLMAVAMPMMGLWGMGHMGTGGWSAPQTVLALVVPSLLVLVVLGTVGYLLYRAIGGDGGRDAALEELRRTYARGELTDEEFEKRRERLQRDSGG